MCDLGRVRAQGTVRRCSVENARATDACTVRDVGPVTPAIASARLVISSVARAWERWERRGERIVSGAQCVVRVHLHQ